MTVYQSVHPSVNPCLPPLHPSQRQVSDWSGRGYFLRPHPSAGQEQGMMTDNTGSRRTHTHSPTHTYSAPTRLLVGFAVSCICILGSRRMHMQMPTMLIVIKGHLSLRFFFSLLFPRSLFCLSSPLYLSLSLLVCFSLSLSLSLSFWPSLPVLYNLVTFSHLSQTADCGLFTPAAKCERAHKRHI